MKFFASRYTITFIIYIIHLQVKFLLIKLFVRDNFQLIAFTLVYKLNSTYNVSYHNTFKYIWLTRIAHLLLRPTSMQNPRVYTYNHDRINILVFSKKAYKHQFYEPTVILRDPRANSLINIS